MTPDGAEQPPTTNDLDQLVAVSAQAASRRIEQALEAAGRLLGMDFSYVAEFVGDEQILRATAGDGASFDLSIGDGYPLDGSYCQRMVTGLIPNIIPATSANDELRDLALTKLSRIGAYAGVPIRLHDGTLYGSFASISHDPRPELSERALRLMEILSHMVASVIEQQRLETENQRLRDQIASLDTELDEAEGDRRLSRILMSGEFQAIPRGTPPPE